VTLLFALSVGLTTPSDAEQRKPGGLSVKDKQGICDAKWITCLDGCDDLIDIGDAVASCQRRCDRRHNTCLKRAQTLEVPEVGVDNGMSTPGLTIAP
jgi:hypothetical protein